MPNVAIVLADEPRFTLGRLDVDPARRIVVATDAVPRSVAPRVMQLLVALAKVEGRVLSRGSLIACCWEGRHVSGDAVERAVAQLRRLAADADAGFTIQAVPRVGYRLALDAPLPLAPAPPEAAAIDLPAPIGVSRRALVLAGGAGVLAAAGGVAWLRRGTGAASAASGASGPVRLAVLPFETPDRDPHALAYAAGLASGIRDQLSRVAGLRVAAESSSRTVGGDRLDAAARRLGVGFLVRGIVRESAGRLRIGIELIDATAATIAWSSTQEGDARAAFAVQDAATGAVLRELVGRIGADRIGALPPAPRLDDQAYRLALEARQWLDTGRAARMAGNEALGLDAGDRAEALATRAVAIDAKAVPALLILADLERNGWSRRLAALPMTPDQRVEASVAHVTRALSVDPNDAAALTALGDYYRRFAWRWDEAETLFLKALAINPSLVEAHWSYAYLLGVTGRAADGLAHASALAALDPASLYRRLALPRLLYLAGDRAGAMRRYAAEQAQAPANLFLLRELYLIALSEGDPAGMRALAAGVPDNAAGTPALSALTGRMTAAADALAGEPSTLRAAVAADVATLDAPAARVASKQGRAAVDYLYIHALEYAWAGERDASLALLERALAARSLYWPATLPYGVAPFPRAVREDARWAALWNSEPQRRDLVARRRRTLVAGRAAGWDDQGRFHRVAAADLERSLAYV